MTGVVVYVHAASSWPAGPPAGIDHKANRLEGLELYDGARLQGFLYREALWTEIRALGIDPRAGIQRLAQLESLHSEWPGQPAEIGLLDITGLVEAQVTAIIKGLWKEDE